MTATELYQAGRLAEAIAQISEDIRKDPGNQKARIFLFELLCFSGDLTRAEKQLHAVAGSEVDSEIAVARYRNLIAAELVRRNVFAGKIRPRILDPVPEYASLHIEAVHEIAENRTDNAISLLEKSNEILPALAAVINGKSFADFGDGDDAIRPFLEAMVEEAYIWIPWESVHSLSLAQPKYLRDLFWLPATLTLKSEQTREVYLPVLYPNSYSDSDDRIRLGRMSGWREDRPGLSLGLGQRVFTAGETDYAMLDISELEFEHADANNASR
jgi:type VI secretion system protein ImpE